MPLRQVVLIIKVINRTGGIFLLVCVRLKSFLKWDQMHFFGSSFHKFLPLEMGGFYVVLLHVWCVLCRLEKVQTFRQNRAQLTKQNFLP